MQKFKSKKKKKDKFILYNGSKELKDLSNILGFPVAIFHIPMTCN